jgi:Flp pilus assembly protein TadG
MNSMDCTRQRGIAMVEFTIVLPVLLLLMLGVTELGRALIRYNALTKTVHDGARFAASFALWGGSQGVNIDPQLLTETRNVVVYGNKDGTGSPVLSGLQTSQIQVVDIGGDQFRVDVSYPYVPMLGPVLPDFGLGSPTPMAFTMQASVSMRAL